MDDFEYVQEAEADDFELIKFECFYHSVIDDVAQLIVTNGYNNVMKDIIDAVDRITDKQV